MLKSLVSDHDNNKYLGRTMLWSYFLAGNSYFPSGIFVELVVGDKNKIEQFVSCIVSFGSNLGTTGT
ncbi:hypothetical protein KGP45_10275 [Pediococcus ethanolidurans]|uniref:hypothetical protein n=1 Tax=Pediococcus ethanolidurans TaxID=319653 RepID=UPI001C1ECE3B|nr:hypothetical protein [Pediococcus ethanolidurans]MBU7564482.1 hypothetical protein [Pediococcus ethanolidurans]